jgi:50S ribosomal protein L16 3-hydroxylase
MLYLPPGWGHDGIAEGPCMTCSIGFRAPSRHEFLAAFLAEAADAPGGADPRFADRGRLPAATPAAIPDDLADTLFDWGMRWRPDPTMLQRFIGRYLTEPKPSVWFDEGQAPAPAAFRKMARCDGLRLDRRSRMLWRDRLIFINGESVAVDSSSRRLLRQLAGRRMLDARTLAALDDAHPLFDLLRGWLAAGWIVPGAAA